tara:strand:+ start:8148 stop:9890 length:1743 start_codon:yes stop_codon:yes gene_type:complete
MKRILVVSPNKSLWDFSKPLLFLGEWCNLFKDNHHNKKLDIQINPYHWNDENKKSSDYLNLDTIYENKLKELSICLSNIHSLKFDERYWRIILGPWLKFFIDAVFDRYESVRKVNKLYKIDYANIYNYKTDDYIPNDFDEFYDHLRYDSWNEIIYFEAIKDLNIPYKKVENNYDDVKKKSFYYLVNNKIKNFLYKINSLIFNSSKKIILYELYMPFIKLIELQLNLIQPPYLGSIKSNIQNRIYDFKVRNQIKLKDDEDDFINFLNKQIINFVPRAYLENFNELRNNILQSFPKEPKLIVTANAYQSNDHFKIWAAHYSKLNVPIIIHQHGGTFGISKYNQTEKHQLKISDYFISWGWKKKNYNNISVLPSLKLSSKKINYQKFDGDILLTLASTPRYFYNFFGIPNGPDFLEYIQDQKLFIKKLNPKTYSKLKIREDSTEFGWEITNRILNSDNSKIDKSNISFRKRLEKSKICISTYNATIFLETLSMNFPTIIFFNSKKNKIRSEALKHFKNLKDIGIFHEDPISAANFLNNIENDIQGWWHTKEVQKEVHKFCSKFAYSSVEWKEKWTNFLIDKKI